MADRFSLRLRIFLFFCLIGLGGAGVAVGALVLGYLRAGQPELLNAFVFSGLLTVLALLGLTVGIWLLFDENVAKPIERLAAQLRTRAHAHAGNADMDLHGARYLGDLGPAAQAVSGQLSASTLLTAETVASHTAQLADERDRLTALLTEIPLAMVIVSPAHRIVLYDGQAGGVLAQIHHPRLNASLFDYFDRAPIEAAHARLVRTGKETRCKADGIDHVQTFDLRLKPLGHGAGYMLIIDAAEAHLTLDQARPLTYDFALLDTPGDDLFENRALKDLTFVVFDTETTGLLPHKDEVVQLGAVRVVRGRLIEGEVIDMLVNPERPIPPASTRVHHVTDAMVAHAPTIEVVGRRFHHFARDAVIVAHNAPFDMAFLRRHAGRMGVGWDHPILDTVLLSAVLFGASQTHTLDALCDRLDVTIPPRLRHTALGDAHATAELLCKMLPMLMARGMTTFGDVIAQTRKHGRLLEDLN